MLPYFAQYDPRQIRRDVRGVVLGVSGFILVITIASTLVVGIGIAVDFFFDPRYASLHNSLLNASNPSYNNLFGSLFSSPLYEELVNNALVKYSGLASIIGMLCGLPLFFLIRGTRFVREDPVRVNSKMKIRSLLILLVLMLSVQFFMTLIQIGIEPFFRESGTSLTDSLDESTTALALNPFGALYIVLLGPLCEELVFRGAVLRKLERYGANFAIIVSSLLFGLYHLILFQAVFAFLVGLVLAYTAGRFSLKWAVLLHVINNGLATLSVFLQNGAFNVALGLLYLLAFIAAIIILIIVGVRGGFTKQLRAGAPGEPRVWARAFSSPWIISYIVLCLLVCVATVVVI